MSGANVGSACAVVAGSFGFVRLRNSRLASVRGRPASAPLGISAGAVIAGSFGFVRLRDSRLASVRVRPASLRSGGFLLLAQEKVTKEKGTLTALVPRASCARDCADALRGLPTVHSCTHGKLGAIHRAAPAGLFFARLPRPKGAEKRKRGHPARTRSPDRVRVRENRLASVPVRPASVPLAISAGAVIAGSFGLVRLRDSRLASVRVRPASMRAGGFLLLAQEKATKENGALTAVVPRASCARDCAGALRGLPTAHPCTNGKLGAIPRAAPAGFSCARLPRPKGVENPRRGHPARTREMSDPVLRTLIRPTPCRAGGSAQAPQVRNRQSSSIEALHGFCSASRARTHCCSGFVAQERAASIPLQRRRAMAEMPAGCARWSARIAPSAQGCAVGATGHRPRTLRARGAQGGAARGALLFGGFLLGEQEKATGPQGCGTNRHGRQSVFDKPNKPRQTHGQGARRVPARRDAERTNRDVDGYSCERTSKI